MGLMDRVSKMNLKRFREEFMERSQTEDRLHRDQPERVLSPGLKECTQKGGKRRAYDRLGYNEKDFEKFGVSPKCRHCGAPMHIVEETNLAIVWGCDTWWCENNKDGPRSGYYHNKSAKRAIGTVRENVFGEM